MRKLIARLSTNTSPMPTMGVIALGAAAIIAQIVLILLTGTPWWGVILYLVLMNGISIPLVIWMERAAKMWDPVSHMLDVSWKLALFGVFIGGVVIIGISYAFNSFEALADLSPLDPFFGARLWLVFTTASTVNVYLKRRAPSQDTLQSDGVHNAP